MSLVMLLLSRMRGQCLSSAWRRFLCADSYHGPGGLSARQIMAKIQEAKARDSGMRRDEAHDAGMAAADRAASVQASRAAATRHANAIPRAKLQMMRTPELVQLLVARGIDFGDCYEHSQLLERASVRLGVVKAAAGATHHPAYQKPPPAAHLRGQAVSRGGADQKD